MTKVLCPTCRGSSYVGDDDCLTCGGTGTADTSEIACRDEIAVEGIRDGR